MNKRWINITAVIGILASALSVTADLLLLYNPEGGYIDPEYAYLLPISADRMLAGHFIGILLIPIELIGLWVIYQGLKPAGERISIAMLLLGTYLGFPGVAYHGTIGFMGYILRNPMADQAAAMEYFKLLSEPLAAIFVGGFFVVSALFVIPILQEKTLFPKWVALFNPILIYAVVFALFFFIPAVGNVLLPAGFNFALGIQIFVAWRAGDWSNLKA